MNFLFLAGLWQTSFVFGQMRLTFLVVLIASVFGARYAFNIEAIGEGTSHAPLVSLRQLQSDEEFLLEFVDSYNNYGGLYSTGYTLNSTSMCGIQVEEGVLQSVVSPSYPTVIPWRVYPNEPAYPSGGGILQLGMYYAPFNWLEMSKKIVGGWYVGSGRVGLGLTVTDTISGKTVTTTPVPSPSARPSLYPSYLCCQYYSPPLDYVASLCQDFISGCPTVDGFFPVGNFTVTSCEQCWNQEEDTGTE